MELERGIYQLLSDYFHLDEIISDTYGSLEPAALERFVIPLVLEVEAAAFDCGVAVGKGDLVAAKDSLSGLESRVKRASWEAMNEAALPSRPAV